MSETTALVPAKVEFQNALVPSVTYEQPIATLPQDQQTRAEIAAARKELNYNDSQSFIFFGASSQTGLTDISSKMIQGVKNKDITPASDALNKVVLNIRGFSLDGLEEHGGAVGWLSRKVLHAATPIAAAMQRYESVESQINVVVTDLDRHIGILMKDVAGLDRMYVEALLSFRKLKIYIMAGEEEIAEINNVKMPALRAAITDDNPLSSQELAKMEATGQRLERRVHDLKLTRQVTLQSLPMITLMQDNDANLIEKIQSAIVNTIPLWMQRIAMLITAKHAEAAAKAVGAVSDLTNELLVSTATAMQKSNKAVRVEVERGIFDLSAVKAANETAIATLDDTRGLYEKAAARRRDEAAQLDKFEADIRGALENTRRAA